MTQHPCSEMQLLLQADLDGELDVPSAALLASHLETCNSCRTQKAALEALSDQLRQNATRHAAPSQLRNLVLDRAQPAKRSRFQILRATYGNGISFTAGLAVAACLAILIVSPHHNDAIPEIVAAHIRALQPGHLLDVTSTDQHTVKPWFDGRLDYAPPVTDFAAEGFPLIGGRLDYINDRPVAALIYRRNKHLIDLFVWPGNQAAPNETVQGYNVISWTQAGMTYRAVSDLAAPDLAQFAKLIKR